MNYNHLLNQFNQFIYLLNEFTDLKNLLMTTPDLWNGNERKLLCYLRLNKSKSSECRNSNDFRTYILSCVLNPNRKTLSYIYPTSEESSNIKMIYQRLAKYINKVFQILNHILI